MARSPQASAGSTFSAFIANPEAALYARASSGPGGSRSSTETAAVAASSAPGMSPAHHRRAESEHSPRPSLRVSPTLRWHSSAASSAEIASDC